MDFNDTAEEAAWRAEFRAWLEENAPKVIGTPPEHDMEIGGGDYLDRAKRWQAMKFDAGSRASRGSPSTAAATARRCSRSSSAKRKGASRYRTKRSSSGSG